MVKFMSEYKTVLNEADDEFVVKKSRFIGYVKPVRTADEAVEFINSIKSKHWDATHNVYAYVLRDGQTRRYSDDGEPQGTAGIPVLDVLLKEELTDVCVVATRYFGGIMLGRLVSGFISMKASDNTMIRGGAAVALLGIVMLLLPIGNAKLLSLVLIGAGFGPIFPSVLHSVPSRFGSEFSADITGYHMGGAYAVGFGTQLLFGYIASATTFKLLPFVLVVFCVLLFVINEVTVRKTAKNP